MGFLFYKGLDAMLPPALLYNVFWNLDLHFWEGLFYKAFQGERSYCLGILTHVDKQLKRYHIGFGKNTGLLLAWIALNQTEWSVNWIV